MKNLWLITLLILSPTIGFAGLYKCTENGKTFYQDKECQKTQVETILEISHDINDNAVDLVDTKDAVAQDANTETAQSGSVELAAKQKSNTKILFVPSSSLQSGYEEIDTYALHTPPSATKSLASLATYLVAPAKTDIQKARVIYRWITENIAYDTHAFFSKQIGDVSAEGVLKSRKSVCAGYSQLYKALAEKAGLQVEVIRGFAKGYGVEVGQSVSEPNHDWNAVKLNDKWQLIDTTWGAGFVNTNQRFEKEFDDYYFLTTPDQFIARHFPEETKWQLLNPAVSARDYAEGVDVKPDFFKFGLKPDSHAKAIVNASQSVDISLKSPADVVFMTEIERNHNRLSHEFTFTQKQGNKQEIKAVFPESGEYDLQLFAKKIGEPKSYKSVQIYRINVVKEKLGAIGFPIAYPMFSENNAYLYSPLEKNLISGEKYLFKISLPNAVKMALVAGKQWAYFTKEGNVFQYKMIPNFSGTDVVIYADFGDGRGFQAVLGYITS